MRRLLSVISLTLTTSLVAFGGASAPIVNNGTINYTTNQVTLTGSSFWPSKTAPAVLFNGSPLALSSFSDTQIIATLPASLVPGTFNLTVTNSSGNSTVFDLTYGAIGPQGPAGPAGPTGSQGPIGSVGPAGPQGPRGLTGAPGAPGPAGTNGLGFSFLNAYDAYATYALNSVVTYNGSSYVAIVPNGPNPVGPAPDKNPSWSMMAAAGVTGATGPTGPQGPLGDLGPQGLMGNPGPTGPAGPVGPQGPTGGVLSFAANTQSTSMSLPAFGNYEIVNIITLPNTGTYILGGQQVFHNTDTNNGATVGCVALNNPNNLQPPPGLSNVSGFALPNGWVTLPLGGYFAAQNAPTELFILCFFQGQATNVEAYEGSVFTAIQVK